LGLAAIEQLMEAACSKVEELLITKKRRTA